MQQDQQEKVCVLCQLVNDTTNPSRIIELPHSVALVNLKQTYRGRSLVIFKAHHEDLLQVPKGLFDTINGEMLQVAAAIQAAFSPDRLNYSIFGNAEPHLHWHVIPRYKDDPHWGHAPWRDDSQTRATDAELHTIAQIIRNQLRSKT